jgi:undecaprenyl diphosphate synthase
MSVPECLVIIPDGNRRWARAQKRGASEGHAEGLLNCRVIVEEAFKRGVQHIVLWGASETNLQKRDPQEVEFLYHLLKSELVHRLDEKNGTHGFRICGTWHRPHDLELIELVERAHVQTSCSSQVLTLLFGYSGQTELVCAARRAALSEDQINADTIRKHLWTSHLPNVDLVIQTGIKGDPHWSDLLLPWQIRSAQLYFTETCWPAFTTQDLSAAFEDFSRRPRRMGA